MALNLQTTAEERIVVLDKGLRETTDELVKTTAIKEDLSTRNAVIDSKLVRNHLFLVCFRSWRRSSIIFLPVLLPGGDVVAKDIDD